MKGPLPTGFCLSWSSSARTAQGGGLPMNAPPCSPQSRVLVFPRDSTLGKGPTSSSRTNRGPCPPPTRLISLGAQLGPKGRGAGLVPISQALFPVPLLERSAWFLFPQGITTHFKQEGDDFMAASPPKLSNLAPSEFQLASSTPPQHTQTATSFQSKRVFQRPSHMCAFVSPFIE